MKIVHITTVHRWDDTRICWKECAGLAKRGYDVRLIAQSEDQTLSDNFKIVGLPKHRSRLHRITGGMWRAIRLALRERADLYHFHDSELIPACIALRLLGKRVVYDVHEILPAQILEKHWIPSLLRRPASWSARLFEFVGASFFNGMVAATGPIGRQFPKSKTVVVQNFAKLSELTLDNPKPYFQRPRNVAYVGTLYPTRGVREAVAAMDLLPSKLDSRLQLGGRFFQPEFEDSVRQEAGWAHVDYWGQCSRSQVAQLLGNSRVGVVNLHPTPNLREAQPVKLYEYMAAGLPVVASDFPIIRQQLEELQCGLLVDPENSSQIADAVQWLLEHPSEAKEMGARGRAAVVKQFSWEVEEEKLCQLYRRILPEEVCASTDDFQERKAA